MTSVTQFRIERCWHSRFTFLFETLAVEYAPWWLGGVLEDELDRVELRRLGSSPDDG